MAAKTTFGSGFDLKFPLLAPAFLLESGFVPAYRQALSDFTLRELPFHYKATQRRKISKSDSHFGTKKIPHHKTLGIDLSHHEKTSK